MVRARPFFAMSVWLGFFVACGEFGIAPGDLEFGGGPGSGADGGPGRNPDGARDPDARVVEPTGPDAAPGCEPDDPLGIPLPCVEDPNYGVFVRWNAADPNGGDGSRDNPYGSFAKAFGGAAPNDNLLGRKTIFAAAGEYPESVLVSGRSVSIYGGFDPQFANAPPRTEKTVIVATGDYALEVTGGGQAMYFDDLELRAPTRSGASELPSSIAAFVHSAGLPGNEVNFRRVSLVAADAGSGISPGPPAQAGNGNCGVDVSGGAGGIVGVRAPQPGRPSGEGGGAAGANDSSGSGTSCAGTDGSDGAARTSPGLAGGFSSTFTIDGSGVRGVLGPPGQPGSAGAGGGGGGGGGAGVLVGGGNGGAGGCGGLGGNPGLPGGHSVGVLAFASSIKFTNVAMATGKGGTGGTGAIGGAGGTGANGEDPFCGKKGGRGGAGSAGGSGGGGVGGSSVCVLAKDAALSFDPPSGWCHPGEGGTGGPGGTGAAPAPGGAPYERAALDANGNLVPAL